MLMNMRVIFLIVLLIAQVNQLKGEIRVRHFIIRPLYEVCINAIEAISETTESLGFFMIGSIEAFKLIPFPRNCTIK